MSLVVDYCYLADKSTHFYVVSLGHIFERLVRGGTICILCRSPSAINEYDSKKPHEKMGAFVSQVTIILLTILTSSIAITNVP